MDALIGRRFRWPILIVAAMACIVLGVRKPAPSPSGVSALESELDAEFTATHAADHERLALMGAGDAAGAARAAAVADLHRARYWRLERILSSDREAQASEGMSPWQGSENPTAVAPPVEAASPGSPPPNPPAPARAAGITRASWDLYSPRLPEAPTPAVADGVPAGAPSAPPSWGMYSQSRPTAKRTSVALAGTDPPQTPFFVYRDPNPPRPAP
jgi:hypothetical protein